MKLQADMPFEKPLKELHTRSQQAGLKRQSKKTKLVHGTDDDETWEIVLPYENLLYCVSLFQVRSQESAEEARILLDRILKFQLENGNFCQYIHEYPKNSNSLTALECLFPLYLIRKYFYPLLTQEGKSDFSKSLERLVNFLEKAFQEIAFPLWAQIKFSALQLGLGLDTLNRFSDRDFDPKNLPLSFFEVATLSRILCVLSIKPFVEKNPNFVQFFTEFLQSTWFSKANKFCGPNIRLLQTKNNPSISLYDLYMGDPKISRLEGSEIYSRFRPLSDEVAAMYQYEGTHCSFTTVRGNNYACTLLKAVSSDAKPFYLVSENHSVVLQCFHGDLQSISSNGSHFVFTFRAPAEDFSESKDRGRLFALFINDNPEIQWAINDKKATAFLHNDKVVLDFDDVKLTFWYEQEDLDSQKFMGHINKSNRSFQTVVSNQQEFFAFDWQIFVRQVRTEKDSEVVLHIQVDEKL